MLQISERARAEAMTTSGANPLRAVLLDAREAAVHVPAWRELAAESLEANAFFEPGFLLPAARLFARRHRPRFLFVWDGIRLVALLPIVAPGIFAPFLPSRIWTNEQAPLGTPLLARDRPGEALAAIFAFWRKTWPHTPGLMFPLIRQDGPVANLLIAAAAAEGRSVARFAEHQRAILVTGADPQRYLEQSISSPRRRRLKKARASLEARGAVSLQLVRDRQDLGPAAKAFFELEAKGWKGRRGTAFLKSPRRATFAREIAENLGGEAKYFVATLALDGRPVAMGLLLESGGCAFWWKIAYDEDFAANSPGVLLASELTRHLLLDSRIKLTDSCSTGEQPWIDHVWSERVKMADLLVSVASHQNARFETLVRLESLRRALRSSLKASILRLRRAGRGHATRS